MANLFFNKGKASKKEAQAELEKLLARDCPDLAYAIRFTSDDGGQVLEIAIEVDNPNENLGPDHPILPARTIWMGWRSVILKVPIGYIEGVMNRSVYDG